MVQVRSTLITKDCKLPDRIVKQSPRLVRTLGPLNLWRMRKFHIVNSLGIETSPETLSLEME